MNKIYNMEKYYHNSHHHIVLPVGKFGYYFMNIIALVLLSLLFRNMGVLIIGTACLTVLCCCMPNEMFTGNKTTYLFLFTVLIFVFLLLTYYGLIEKFGTPYYGNDDMFFESSGEAMYRMGAFTFQKLPRVYNYRFTNGYMIIISWIYRISEFFGGYHTIIPRIVNIYLWQFVSVLVYKMVRNRAVSLDTSFKCFGLLSIWPNALYISSFVYRDIVVTFIVIVFYYCVEKILSKKSIFSTVLSAVVIVYCVYATSYIRSQILFVFIALSAFKLITNQKDTMRRSTKFVIMAVAALVAVLLLYISGGIETLTSTNDYYSEYNSSVVSGLSQIVFSMPLLPFGALLRTLYGYVVPFPTEIFMLSYISEPLYSLIRLLVCIGTILQLFTLPYLLRQIKGLKSDAISCLIVYASIVLTTFTFRHFVMLYPFLAIVVSSEYDIFEGNRLNRLYVPMAIVVVFAGFAYLVMKFAL